MYTLSFSADITNASTLLWLPPAIIINCQTTVGQEPDKTAPISTIVLPNMSPSSSLMLLQSTFCLGHEAALKSCSICYIYQVIFCPGASMESSCGDPGSPLDSLGKCLLTVWKPQCHIVSNHYHVADDHERMRGSGDGDDNVERNLVNVTLWVIMMIIIMLHHDHDSWGFWWWWWQVSLTGKYWFLYWVLYSNVHIYIFSIV